MNSDPSPATEKIIAPATVPLTNKPLQIEKICLTSAIDSAGRTIDPDQNQNHFGCNIYTKTKRYWVIIAGVVPGIVLYVGYAEKLLPWMDKIAHPAELEAQIESCSQWNIKARIENRGSSPLVVEKPIFKLSTSEDGDDGITEPREIGVDYVSGTAPPDGTKKVEVGAPWFPVFQHPFSEALYSSHHAALGEQKRCQIVMTVKFHDGRKDDVTSPSNPCYCK